MLFKCIISITPFVFILYNFIMADDLLFDYMFLNAQDKEENERLSEENEDLREQLNNRQTSNINHV